MHPTADLTDPPATGPSTGPATGPAADAPTAAWPGAAPTIPDTSLVGREADLATIHELVLHPDHGFITLVGVGGVGKSRLAAEVAMRSLPEHGGRIASVPLDAVSDSSMVLPAIAGALGVADEPGRPLAEALAEALGDRPALLVLDTMEHLRAAAPALADLRARTSGLTILATSRVALGVPREKVVWVEPLAVPTELVPEAEQLLASPAASLFLERARVVRPDVEVNPANAALIADICRRLDGIPLAIELAAAALRVLAPHQLLDQLSERLAAEELDPAPGAAGPERQRNLRAAMDWSIGLLGP